MRKSLTSVCTIAFAVVLLAGWAGFAQVKDKSKDKPNPTAKKSLEAAKPASDTAKKPGGATPETTKNAKQPADQPEESADEKAIRASAEAFSKLYNDHDSKSLAALFAPKAEMIDEDDRVVKGRDSIEKAFAEVFETFPKSSMKVEVESLRVLTPNLAIEEGTTLSRNSPDDSEDETTYVAIHVKIEGKWLLGCVRDWDAPPPEPTPHDHLQDLAWLVGEWVEECPESVVHTVCRWHDNDNFLMQEFKAQIGGEIVMSGTMRIGWDAVRKQFKSWVFDSNGGHAEGSWLQNGDEWIVKSQGATAAGEAGSATNVYRLIDEDTLGWRSFDRMLDGERQEDIDEIIVKRRPPSPLE